MTRWMLFCDQLSCCTTGSSSYSVSLDNDLPVLLWMHDNHRVARMRVAISRSGSSFGQGLELMKHSVRSIMETLGENDFVNIAQASDVLSSSVWGLAASQTTQNFRIQVIFQTRTFCYYVLLEWVESSVSQTIRMYEQAFSNLLLI